MSNSEFKARALYDFNAEGSNELSFRANDILTITSNTAGNGWWFAKSSTGKIGVIPENYVQALADPPEPNEPPPLIYNGNTSRTPVATSQYNQHQYMNPPSYNSWQTQESPTWPAAPSTNKLTPSLQTLNFPTENSSSYNARTPPDDYMTVVDVSPTDNFVPFVDPNPPTQNNLSVDLLNGWYDVLPNAPAPSTQSNSNELLFQFNFSQSQTNTFNDHSVPISSSLPASEPTYINLMDEPLASASYSADAPISSQARPSISSDTTSKRSSSPTKGEPSTFANDDLESSKKKKKKKLPKILRLSHKNKSEKKKDPITEEIPHSSRKESDSDDSFDSEDPSPSPHIINSNPQSKHPTVKRTNTLPSNTTLPGQGRTSLATTEATKGPPRARFFDKHGLDSYLLNGCKAKTDEHAEISFNEREGGVCWSINANIPPFSCKVEDPSKGTKLGGLKAFMEYKVHPQIVGSRTVGRRYKQFYWLHEQLVNKFRFICIPPLPGKQIAGRFEQEFIEERRRLLELWLNRVCRHPVLCASFPVQHFITCELTEKNKKDWKTGKRRVEKDELREAPWLQCVTLTNSGLSDPQIISQIDTFAQQQPGLESQLKNLSQGLDKYIGRHTEVYERDIQRMSELFSKVHLAVQVDTTTPGNKDLSNSIFKTSGSYNGIAELYKTKASEGLRDFNERIQEYIGIIACFPSILSIQRSATDFIKTNQQRGTADFSNAVCRVHILNHVVLAEINFFQKEKVSDLNSYFKTMVDEQIQFYEKITGELRDASNTFK